MYSDYVNLDSNPKQKGYVKAVLDAVQGRSKHRIFAYLGGVRSGKTIGALTVMHILASSYCDLRFHAIRRASTDFTETTIPSFEQKFGAYKGIKKWSHSNYNRYVEYKTGTRITFKPESYKDDKDFNRWKGFETNLVLLEQAEELQYKLYQKVIERCGTWANPYNFPPIIMLTANPTDTWVRKEFYDKHHKGTLPDDVYYCEAVPTDNKDNLNPEIWQAWDRLDDVQYERFILNNWDARPTTDLFFYNFKRLLHVKESLYDVNKDLWLSFDFNISPMTAILVQKYGDSCEVLREYRMLNTDIETFARYIKDTLPSEYRYNIWITGDPSGRSSHALLGRNVNFYRIIQDVLDVAPSRIVAPIVAPTHENSYVHCNHVIKNLTKFHIDPCCEYLLHDVMNMSYYQLTKQTPLQRLKEGESGDTTTIGHLLDCLRYFLHTAYSNMFPKK